MIFGTVTRSALNRADGQNFEILKMQSGGQPLFGQVVQL